MVVAMVQGLASLGDRLKRNVMTTSELLASIDCRDWAREFNKMAVKLGYSEMDEGWLIGWFSNAMCARMDYDARSRAQEQPLPLPPVTEKVRTLHDEWVPSLGEKHG